MYNLNIAEMLPYFELSEKFWNMLEDPTTAGTPSYNKLLHEKLVKLDEVAKAYAQKLELNSNDQNLYVQDVNYAIQTGNLHLIDILLWARPFISDVDFRSTDMPLLYFLTSYFENPTYSSHVNFAQYLFEQILDTAEVECDDYPIIVQKLSELNVELSWFKNFFYQINKLLANGPLNNEMLSAVRALREKVTNDSKVEIDEYIKHNY